MVTLSSADIQAAAQSLFKAEQDRQQVGLLSARHPEATMDDAYAVQAALVALKEKSGLKRRGWKIGLTSKAMQYALDIDIPDSGVLFDNMFFANGATVPAGRFIQPRIEAEIAFVLDAPLKGPGVTMMDVLDATRYIAPAIEILDTRIMRKHPETGVTRTFFDTISDNAANGGIALGGRAVKPNEFDMRWIGAIISRNAEVEETGLGAGVLNQPAESMAWLANRLGQYGNQLSAGDVVLSGSFIRPVECRHGDTIVADFGSFGTVSLYFE